MNYVNARSHLWKFATWTFICGDFIYWYARTYCESSSVQDNWSVRSGPAHPGKKNREWRWKGLSSGILGNNLENMKSWKRKRGWHVRCYKKLEDSILIKKKKSQGRKIQLRRNNQQYHYKHLDKVRKTRMLRTGPSELHVQRNICSQHPQFSSLLHLFSFCM